MLSTIDQSATRTEFAFWCPATVLFWILVLVLASIPACLASTPVNLVLTVLGPEDEPLPQFEALIHSHQHGYVSWQRGTDGKIDFWSEGVQTLRTSAEPQFQVIVRAPNLAPAVLHSENTGNWMHETVKLTPGRLIDLSIRTADGTPLPESVTPLVVYPDFTGRVRAARQPENIRPDRPSDFVMSKVRRMADGHYQFRVPTEPAPFFLAIHDPGFMLSLESKIITDDELADRHIEWQLPAPATLHLQFDLSDVQELPAYRHSRAQVSSCIPEVGKYYTVWLRESETLSFDASIRGLIPGRHRVRVMLLPPEDQGDEGNGGSDGRVFRETAVLNLTPGQDKTLVLEYTPFEPNAWHGHDTLTVTLNRYAGRPANGAPFKLDYVDPHYGSVIVLEGKLDNEGRFRLHNVRPGPDGPEFFLSVDDRWARRIRMTQPGSQEFEFTLAPQVGDRIPDVELLDLATGRPLSLRSLQGNIIYLEFWATWCGPCKVPMAHLNKVARKQREAWKGRVHILAASIDSRSEIVTRYAEQRGWTHVRHCWAGDETGEAFDSKAARAFGLRGVPTALLIDPQGRIVWKGHPRSADCESQINVLLKQTRVPR